MYWKSLLDEAGNEEEKICFFECHKNFNSGTYF